MDYNEHKEREEMNAEAEADFMELIVGMEEDKPTLCYFLNDHAQWVDAGIVEDLLYDATFTKPAYEGKYSYQGNDYDLIIADIDNNAIVYLGHWN